MPGWLICHYSFPTINKATIIIQITNHCPLEGQCLPPFLVNIKLQSWPNSSRDSRNFMHEKPRDWEDCDLYKVTDLNTAELWTHFWVPALSPSALCCFIFLLCAYSYQHLVARAVLQWLTTAREPWRTIKGGLPLPFHVSTACEWHWWAIRKVNLERRQQPQPWKPIRSDIWLLPDDKVMLI